MCVFSIFCNLQQKVYECIYLKGHSISEKGLEEGEGLKQFPTLQD